jgi:transcriptional regulator with XRE-family HTH domain
VTSIVAQTGSLGFSFREAPERFVVTQAEAAGIDALLSEFTSWVELPAVAARPPQLGDLVRRARALTDWSTRELADIIGTTHTTVRAFEQGSRVSARSRPAASRVRPLVDVLTRLAWAAGGAPDALATALRTPSEANECAFDLLAAGEWTRGYLACLDVLRGPRPDMLAPLDDWPVLPATRELS